MDALPHPAQKIAGISYSVAAANASRSQPRRSRSVRRLTSAATPCCRLMRGFRDPTYGCCGIAAPSLRGSEAP